MSASACLAVWFLLLLLWQLLEECTALHRLITLASDQSENLSFLSKLPQDPLPFTQPWPLSVKYNSSKGYVAIMISDGDNIAEDWATLRPMIEERLQAQKTGRWSGTPVSWTISNRWLDWGQVVLRWAYEQAATIGIDSFLMGPSGYGYLFPGNITHERGAQTYFASLTGGAAKRLDMEAYVHWCVRLVVCWCVSTYACAACVAYTDLGVASCALCASLVRVLPRIYLVYICLYASCTLSANLRMSRAY